ncbi:hypothetical protein PTKIN_Ptkin08bG0133200 [Pterospermum kingtungense]
MLQSIKKMENVAYKSHLLLMTITQLLLLSASSAELPTRKILGQTARNPLGVQLDTTEPNRVVVDNGLVAVTIEKPSGFLTVIKYKGIDNVLETSNPNSNKGYWDIVWDSGAYDKLITTEFKVITQTDDLVELSFTKKWDFETDQDATYKEVPLNIDKRFILRRGVPGVYMYGIFERQEDFPDANMYQARIAFKLNKQKFRFMAISDTRQRRMPRGEDRDDSRSEILAFKEAVVLTNPTESEFRGEVDDKYQYSMENKDNKLQGWISDDNATGFWIITPSNEFRTGGPHKQDLTSHVGPTALSMFVSTHYTGTEIDTAYKKGEAWKKVFGPVFVYLNSASPGADTRKTLWKDAKRQLSEEIASWPYNFAKSEDFPHADQRGEVSGQLLVRDRYMAKQLMRARSAFVGLAAPGNVGSWQKEGKGYQFWTQTDNTGRFIIKNVRPGEYNLYGWVRGFIGSYKLDLNITIQPGNKMNLGTLIYDPPRNGPTLWEIGIPDRTAAEFFIPDPYPTLTNSLYIKGDKFRQYGIWDRYSDIYRQGDLVFTVGVSNYSQHWFYAHVPRNVGNNTYRPTTWQIKFNLENLNKSGNYTFQLALAAATYAELEIRFNNPNAVEPYFTTTRIGADNAIARHGIHGLYRLYSINVPAGNTLQNGENTIFLTQTRSQDAFKGVMYDYIRLEGPTA